LSIYDAVKRIDANGRLAEDIDRASLRRIQTPQAFAFDLIAAVHDKAHKAGIDGLPDDAAVLQWAGHSVYVCEGEAENMKLTTPEDFAKAESHILSQRADIRIGQGFDVHAFGEGDHVWLGGLKIPHHRAMVGHSDADVVLHAITDALLGALCDGDIGQHFPPSDPQWKGARSDIFLKDALRRVAQRQGIVAHIDVTIICEAPKISPHREMIRAQIAQIAGLNLDRISVKATTTEQLGFTGRKEGIAAMALATIRLPLQDLG
jgi:2-C-methyl-D-erythritol 4-phosphate cytidylyltransferase/2-C-methyl-D-erythritol 2,4-cyclodiphosphate synthase